MERNSSFKPARPPQLESDENKREAIIYARGRPTVKIQNDTFPTVPLGPFQKQVELAFYMVKNFTRSVGRIYAVSHNPKIKLMKYFGTGWLIHDNIMVTNRHVALCFCATNREIQRGITVKVNFTAEHLSLVTEEAGIAEVLYIASAAEADYGVDIAILRLAWPVNHPPRSPIPLEPGAVVGHLPKKHPIVVIGHPAYDSRNPDEEMSYYFDDIYDVKRLSPGYAYKDDTMLHHPTDIFHDATTLGGSSGSVILSLVTGRAIGLHYGGVYGVANVAVESAKIVEIANRLFHGQIMRPLPAPPAPLLTAPPRNLERVFSEDELNGRSGYDPAFLQHEVPLPTVRPDLQDQLAMHENGTEFKYEHFSIVFNKDRRLAFFTAVNIDGRKLVQVHRRDVWKYDPRIPLADQLSNTFYSNARKEGLMFDRGHLVRRLDPCWGDDGEVTNANEDTFHFTNCSPQHKDLNQKTWLELENYVLNRATDNNFLVTVFTGPVLSPVDGYYDGVQIPSEFWKVVVTLHNNKLFATAYIQTQDKLIRNYLEGPEYNQPYGRFKTYQTPITVIQKKTGVLFPKEVLVADPLGRREGPQPVIEIKSEEDIQFA